jgi:mRNA interferase MazF
VERLTQGEVWWANLPPPAGRRPVVVVQGNAFNRSNIRTVVCVPLTAKLDRRVFVGNVELSARSTGLPRASVAVVSQIGYLHRNVLASRAGTLAASKFEAILAGIDLVLGRTIRSS